MAVTRALVLLAAVLLAHGAWGQDVSTDMTCSDLRKHPELQQCIPFPLAGGVASSEVPLHEIPWPYDGYPRNTFVWARSDDADLDAAHEACERHEHITNNGETWHWTPPWEACDGVEVKWSASLSARRNREAAALKVKQAAQDAADRAAVERVR